MMREINEEVRRRMLADESVQKMIRLRAYDIYQQRGGAPGCEAEDWLQAESEVLSYLMSQRAAEGEATAAKKTSSRSTTRSTATRKKKEATATEKKPARRAAKKSVEPEAKPKKTQKTRKKKEE
ncbi:MAG: DUF2934 domain-containing protein [Acidobacteriota bacterium]